MTIYAIFACFIYANNPAGSTCPFIQGPFKTLAECQNGIRILGGGPVNGEGQLVCKARHVDVWEDTR